MSVTRNGLVKRTPGATFPQLPKPEMAATISTARAADLLALAQEYLGDHCVRLSITPRETHPVVYIGSVAAGFEGNVTHDQLFPTDQGLVSLQTDTFFSPHASTGPFLQPNHVSGLRDTASHLSLPLLHVRAEAGAINPILEIDALSTPDNKPPEFEPLPETGVFVRLNLISPEEALAREAKARIFAAMTPDY